MERLALPDTWIGKQVGPYRILERIGFGGMGVVYRAVDIRLGREAALKFLSAEMQQDRRARERFEREARAASALNHPNICTVYGVDEFEGHPYLALELLKGQTLADVISDQPLAVDRLLELAIPVLSALEAAHAEGIIHRDLKPANIFLTEKGHLKILDFGLAKHSALVTVAHGAFDVDAAENTATLTTPGMIVGTVSYMSPEQIRAEAVDARSDLFSLGVVLYEMATGQPAFPGRLPVLVMDAILNRPPAQISETNPGSSSPACCNHLQVPAEKTANAAIRAPRSCSGICATFQRHPTAPPRSWGLVDCSAASLVGRRPGASSADLCGRRRLRVETRSSCALCARDQRNSRDHCAPLDRCARF